MNVKNGRSDNSHQGEQMNADAGPEILQDPVLEQALSDLRVAVHAWSDATYNRDRGALVTDRKSRRVGKECRSRWSPYH